MDEERRTFWDDLEKTHGNFPKYLKEILTVLGFTHKFSLLALDKEKLEKVYVLINETVQKSKDWSDDDPLKAIIKKEIEPFHMTPDSFKIPYGQQLLIESMVNDFKRKNDLDVTTSTSVPEEQIKTRFKELIIQIINKYVQESVRINPYELNIIFEQGNWYAYCPFCDNTKIKLQIERHSKCNASNLRIHFINKHSTPVSEIEIVEETSETQNQSTDPSIEMEQNELVQIQQSTSGNSNEIVGETSQNQNAKKDIDFISKLNIPFFLRECVLNAVENFGKMQGSRYKDLIKKIATYIYIRGGNSLYQELTENMVLPNLKTVRRFIERFNTKIIEGKIYSNELKTFLVSHNLPLEVIILEDGTKVSECVEYDATNKVLVGLVSPLQESNGLPQENFHTALRASEIIDSISNYKKAGYIQVIIAKCNTKNSPYFILGIYSTDNCFTFKDVLAKNKFIQDELNKCDINVLGFGSDGDTRYLKSQKIMMNYGKEYDYCDFPLAASLHSEIMGTQDSMHVLKKLKAALYDDCDLLKMGNYYACLGHLVIVFKDYDKFIHKLVISDIDPFDTMNYKSIDKILNENVIRLLKNVRNANATIAFLELMKGIQKAYVMEDIQVIERFFAATWTLHFLRIWKSWLIQNNITLKHFISSNAYECLEINFVFLLKLLLMNKAENIFFLNSQIVESFFRKMRSFCGIEDLTCNASVKGILTRIQKIQLEEKIIAELESDMIFKRHEKSKSTNSQEKANLSNIQIERTIIRAITYAEVKASSLGMNVESFKLSDLINQVSDVQSNRKRKISAVEESVSEGPSESEAENESNEVSPEFEPRINLASEIASCESSSDDGDENSELMTFNYENAINFQGILLDDSPSESSKILGIHDGKETIISKNQLCSLLQDSNFKLSNDVKRRFITKKDILIKKRNATETFWKESEIGRGDSIVIQRKDNIYFGRIINMQYSCKNNKNQRRCKGDFVLISSSKMKDLEVLLDPIYRLNSNFKATELEEKSFYKAKYYVCHIQKDVCSLSSADIEKLRIFLN